MSPYDTRYGYCKCGCGEKTKIASRNDAKRGWVRGRPIDYIVFHGSRHKLSDEEKFWKKIDKSGGPDACWLWTGGCASNGYGHIFFAGKHRSTHIVAWFLAHGEWPKLHVLHTCDNHPCCNFSHLFQGTHSQNMEDMVSKGRSLKGVRNPKSKLTEKRVRNIRKLYAKGWPPLIIAERYSVTRKTIYSIINGKTWTHVT